MVRFTSDVTRQNDTLISNKCIFPPYTFLHAHVCVTCSEYPRLTLILLMWRIGWSPKSITIYSYIQQDATLHGLFISGNCSTCFGWYFHPSS